MAAIDILLEQTIAELQGFVAVLAAERNALVSGDIDQLPTIAGEKSQQAVRLANLEAERDAAQRSAGFAAGRAGLDAWVGANTRPTAALGMLQRYLELAAAAKRENELNGKLIAARMQQNQQALATLLGEAADATPYGADGQQKSSSGRRPLGSA
ncbi:MAG: flagellar protein FlgN [Sulfuritalea sp.]|nr:flagellar protein FlgN [Sulfuritalea sp.]